MSYSIRRAFAVADPPALVSGVYGAAARIVSARCNPVPPVVAAPTRRPVDVRAHDRLPASPAPVPVNI